MTQLSARIVAGIGFASAATAQELVELIEASLVETGLASTRLRTKQAEFPRRN